MDNLKNAFIDELNILGISQESKEGTNAILALQRAESKFRLNPEGFELLKMAVHALEEEMKELKELANTLSQRNTRGCCKN